MKKIICLLLLFNTSIAFGATSLVGTGIKVIDGVTLTQDDSITSVVFNNMSVVNCSNCGAASLQEVYNGGASITTTAAKDQVIVKYGGDNGVVQQWQKADSTPIFTLWTSGAAITENIAILEDRKAAGTLGGTCTASSYIVRTLNTERISNSFVNLSSNNQFIVEPGTYYIEAMAPAYVAGFHRINIYNVTDATYLTDTSNVSNPVIWTGVTASYPGVPANLYGRFTISSDKVFSLVHRCSGTRANDGFGTTTNLSETEIFSRVKIRREK